MIHEAEGNTTGGSNPAEERARVGFASKRSYLKAAAIVLVLSTLCIQSSAGIDGPNNGGTDCLKKLEHGFVKEVKTLVKNMTASPVANTTNGPVRGWQADRYTMFLGIRFAAPPTGRLRWRSPESPIPWEETKDALWFGHSCPQHNNIQTWNTSFNEDCLFLNVYSPINATKGSKLPVILFFYGGSWESGASSFPLYWANRDIEEVEDVIYVTANYRINEFGFLASEALRKDSPDGSVGNYGLQDQRFAMKWAQDNIENFGGDPNLVTIQGESAGAGSVSCHLVSPLSKGLFKRAIMESGPISAWSAQSFDLSTQKYHAIVSNTSCNNHKLYSMENDDVLECLRNLTTQEIMSAAGNLRSGILEWSPVVDGVEIPDDPRNLASEGRVHNVPVLLGSNKDEGTYFVNIPRNISTSTFHNHLEKMLGKDLAQSAAEHYPPSQYSSPWWALTHLIGDSVMTCPTRRTARWLTGREEAANVYEYFFQHEPEFSERCDLNWGAYHSSELIYVFNMQSLLWTEGEKNLSLQMVRYWTKFARYGNPNGVGDLRWPAYSNSSDTLLVLDTPEVFNESNVNSEKCNFWDKQDLPSSFVWGYSDNFV